ncbi:DUF4291 family protein [Streptomyces griseorubiginosus]|uniref:DUF4291 family protein n=1 Tax=Streptomyces griseorubiginosus TaxID=67304 RepID=UPI003AF36602
MSAIAISYADFDSGAAPQWDPGQDLCLRPLPYRSLQLGLAGAAAQRDADEWTVAVRDVTPPAHGIRDLSSADALLPQEHACPVGDASFPHFGRG